MTTIQNNSLLVTSILVAVLATSTVATLHAQTGWQDYLYDEAYTEVVGFVDARYGMRLQEDSTQKNESLAEARLQIQTTTDLNFGYLNLKGDVGYDAVTEEAITDLRLANVDFSLFGVADMRVGRQILTWGTGDMLFINDLFPKDWISFFTGRDVEYLKAPSDAVRLSAYTDIVNVEFVYIPVSNSSQYISGERLSYWNPMMGSIVGRNGIAQDEPRNTFFDDQEFAVRVFTRVDATELALYVFDGFWKTPEGFLPERQLLYFPHLTAYGASARTPLLGGIGNIEIGYYDSGEESSSSNPFVRNNEVRVLAGLERELVSDVTIGLQYYAEWMQDYDEYLSTAGPLSKDELRSVVTMRLRWQLFDQTATFTTFTYYSPSDRDGYVKPTFAYKATDNVLLEAGANVFFGEQQHTFFGQFQDNTNAHIGVRYSY